MRTIARKIVSRVANAFGPGDSTALSQKPLEELLAALDPRLCTTLRSMYRGEAQPGTDGRLHTPDNITRISPSQGMWLYDLCLAVKPKHTLEIGMAYGYSTLYFLAAIARNQSGHHTAIDPFQNSYWHGIGLAHANDHLPAAGKDTSFRFIEDRAEHAATDLARTGSRFDLIFIDGNHCFDAVLVDFYLYAPLCAIGGRIVFDDLWMSSVQTAVAFLRTNRADFVELPVTESNVCVFQRVSGDLRQWDHFQEFAVARGTGGKR